jgi:hypothetical protein
MGDFWVAILGGLLNGPTHNPNDHLEDEAITSAAGVLNIPPLKGVVGEIAVRERAAVTEPDTLVDICVAQRHRWLCLGGGPPCWGSVCSTNQPWAVV